MGTPIFEPNTKRGATTIEKIGPEEIHPQGRIFKPRLTTGIPKPFLFQNSWENKVAFKIGITFGKNKMGPEPGMFP